MIKIGSAYKSRVQNMKTTNVLLILVIGIVQISFGQQAPTDSELNFDSAYYTALYSQENSNSSDVQALVAKMRSYYIKRYNSIGNENNLLIPTNLQPSCTNMGFEDNNFNGWCRRTGVYKGYTIENGYDVIYDDIDDISLVICDNSIMEDLDCGDDSGEPLSALEFEIQERQIGQTDLYGIDLGNIEGNYAVKLGNSCLDYNVNRIEQSFIVDNSNSVFEYRFALVFQDIGVCDHIVYDIDCNTNNLNNLGDIQSHHKPYFTVFLEFQGQKIECSEYLIFGDENTFEFDSVGGVLKKDWSKSIINLLDFVNLGDEVKIVAEVADCGYGGHFGYAYFEASCSTNTTDISASSNNICVNDTVTFVSDTHYTDYLWSFYDNNGVLINTNTNNPAQFQYTQTGYYKVTYGPPSTGTTGLNCSQSLYIDVEDCGQTNETCEDCYSFRPLSNKKYWLSAWVKEEKLEQVLSYNNSFVQVTYSTGSNTFIGSENFYPSGEIIEGWQRIVGSFKIPPHAVYFNLNLINDGGYPAYFDDVRVHPFNGNMKSFVYDNENYRLMAELDENNFATFYEYDNEGGLVRVKKETEKGVMTIQETRSSTKKIEND
ncbi:hypothetical protein [Psychroserpens mesophilus]|uniref:hypothetical protein n=1 Tax=Psychroserpens mesophilus TaxID=325473 RepID=UPI00058D4CA9|nr:hypothetical protein [Psychroserpens mesophilus]